MTQRWDLAYSTGYDTLDAELSVVAQLPPFEEDIAAHREIFRQRSRAPFGQLLPDDIAAVLAAYDMRIAQLPAQRAAAIEHLDAMPYRTTYFPRDSWSPPHPCDPAHHLLYSPHILLRTASLPDARARALQARGYQSGVEPLTAAEQQRRWAKSSKNCTSPLVVLGQFTHSRLTCKGRHNIVTSTQLAVTVALYDDRLHDTATDCTVAPDGTRLLATYLGAGYCRAIQSLYGTSFGLADIDTTSHWSYDHPGTPYAITVEFRSGDQPVALLSGMNWHCRNLPIDLTVRPDLLVPAAQRLNLAYTLRRGSA